MSLGSSIALATERIVAPVEGMHRAISGRWFGLVGPVGAPVRLAHDAISSLVYQSIRWSGNLVGVGLDQRASSDPSAGDSAQAFVNGLWGDRLGRRQGRLGITMAVRDRRGAEVPPGQGLATAIPSARGRVVVLVHGLVETEQSWAGSKSGQPSLLESIERHPELTPLLVRYNTGLRVSTNGAALSTLLETVFADWPVPLESISLVGHSLGGLVVRSACIAARAEGHGWIDRVDDIVALGSPHRGAPLEKLVNVVSWGLKFAPETRPLAEFLNGRSAGIKDLRFGAIVEDDWRDADPDALLRNTVGNHSLPSDIRHHFVSGVVTADPTHPVGVAMGDLMVGAASSGGQHLEPANVAKLGGIHHFDLVHDPAVIDRVMSWLSPQPRLPARAGRSEPSGGAP